MHRILNNSKFVVRAQVHVLTILLSNDESSHTFSYCKAFFPPFLPSDQVYAKTCASCQPRSKKPREYTAEMIPSKHSILCKQICYNVLLKHPLSITRRLLHWRIQANARSGPRLEHSSCFKLELDRVLQSEDKEICARNLFAETTSNPGTSASFLVSELMA